MLEKARSLWARLQPDEVDVATVLATTDVDREVAHLIQSVRRNVSEPVAAPFSGGQPVRLLESDVVAVVAWWKQHHVYCFDVDGLCIGVAERDWAGAVGWQYHPRFEFDDRVGRVFSVESWSSQSTSLIGGRTAARVTIGSDVVGTYDQVDGGTERDAQGTWLASVMREKVKRGTDRRTLVSPSGDELARYCLWHSSKRTATRRVLFATVIEFAPDTSPDIRALTLAGELCVEIQAQKDLAFGD